MQAAKASTQKTYGNIIERFRDAHGDKRVATVTVEHLDAIIGRMKDTPAAANNLRKVLRRLFAYAVKIGLRADNPALLTDSFKIDSEGFHTWTEAEIAQFQARHPVGTKARLALELLLWTAQRGRSDVTRFGPSARCRRTPAGAPDKDRDGRVYQAGTGCPGGHRGVPVWPPHLPCDGVRQSPSRPPALATGSARAATRRSCPTVRRTASAKAMSRRIAESGGTHSEGKAVTGHKTDREFTRYAADADQVRLADTTIDRLADETANRDTGIANPTPNPLQSKG